MTILFGIILLDLILTYIVSAIGAGMYFDNKFHSTKILYFIVVFTPIWNTYFAIKYITSNYGTLKELFKYHFTWDKE